MSTNVTRRNFVAAASAAVGAAALVGCTSSSDEGSATSSAATETATSYPIEVDGDDVEALWTSEETRDGWIKVTNPDDQPTIGVMDEAKIIQVDGLAFRDMNGNGKLDEWEDWRLDAATRAAALAASLTAEDIFPLLWAGGPTSGSAIPDTEESVSSEYDWVAEGSRAGVSRLCSTIDSYSSDISWINGLQEVCEQSELGIPYLNTTDPYELFNVPQGTGIAACMDKDLWRKAGMWQARAWRATGVRCELGPQIDVYSNPIGTRLSAAVTEDPALARDFTQAFCGGMQSTWGDDDATDDLGWGDESCAVMLKHYAGEGCPEGGRDDHTDMGKWNVFPGSNFEAHLIPFIDGGMNLDSVTGQMASVMPCYGISYDPNDPDGLGEHVGSAYSAHHMSILRNAGWDGMYCTDWGIIGTVTHGTSDLTEAERMAKLMNNSISMEGGDFYPEYAEAAYELMVEADGEEAALTQLQENARRIFELMVNVDLFDQPYSERTVAKEVLESETAAALGIEIADKCVIMLKNADGTISAEGLSGNVYIPTVVTDGATSLNFGADFAEGYFTVVTDTVGDPTGTDDDGNAIYQDSDVTETDLSDVAYAIVKVSNPTDAYQGVEGGASFLDIVMGTDTDVEDPVYKPLSLQYRAFTADQDYVRTESLNPEDELGVYENRSVYGESTYCTNESDLDLVISVKERLPEGAKLILVVDADRPMCFYEIEPYADAILLGFNSIYEEAFAHVISGQVEPSGLLPFQMPLDMQTVFEQEEDVPRDMECYEDAEGNTYDFCFGLNWSGVIDDDRVATYSVEPLTSVETADVVADE